MISKLARWELGTLGVLFACLSGRFHNFGSLWVSIPVHFIFPVIFGVLAKYVFWNYRFLLVFIFTILIVTLAEISRIYHYSLVVGIDYILTDGETQIIIKISYLVQLSVAMAAAFGLHLVHHFSSHRKEKRGRD